jgi:D-alanine-D-alanine ligase-like ATP-grasp enzyme
MSIKNILSRENYPYVTRSLVRLFNEGRLDNIKDITIEPEYGHVTRIEYKNGSCHITYGADLGINSGASSSLSKDKGYTKFYLRDIGVNCPAGKEFLLPWWVNKIRPSQEKRGNNDLKTTDQAASYIRDTIHYPVYVKPVNGSQGVDVYKVGDDKTLNEIFTVYEEKKVRVAIVEESIMMPDYRIVMLDGQLISAYKRIPLAVVGDGESSIEKLISNLQEQYILEGRDTKLDSNDDRIIKYLENLGLNLQHIPSLSEKITLLHISNLSAGGTSEDVTDIIDHRWIKLGKYIAKNFNLRLCGIDIACDDITSSESQYSILEVNDSPGLGHYASSGSKQKRIVDNLYVKVFNTVNPTL